MTAVPGLIFAVGALLLPFTSVSHAADAGTLDLEAKSAALGKALGASVTASTTGALAVSGSSQQVVSTTVLTILGDSLQALQTVVATSDTIDGTQYAEYYSFGKRIFSQNFYFKNDGFLQVSAGITPVEVRVPIVTYPVGPLLLEIAGGVRFDAEVDAQLQPTIIVNEPASSLVTAKITGNASGTGFIEGDADLVAIRAGVGGDVVLAAGTLDIEGGFRFDGTAPAFQYGAMFSFLNGELYGFADDLNILTLSWNRFWQYDFYKWKGECYAAGNEVCPAS